MKKLVKYLYYIYTFLLIMQGCHAWFFWTLEDPDNTLYRNIFLLSSSAVFFMYYRLNIIRLSTNIKTIGGLFLLYAAYILKIGIGIGSIIKGIFYIFPLWVLMSDRHNLEGNLSFFIKTFAFIVAVGILMHIILMQSSFTFPGYPIMHPVCSINYTFFNYGFVLKSLTNYEADGIRFQSIFLEAGYFGLLCSFLLYTIKYDFTKYKFAWIILIGDLVSLSLAAYVVTAIGYVLRQWAFRKSIKIYFAYSLLIVLLFLFIQEYNNGNNILNEKIVERLTFDEEKGIKGNNRVGNGTDFYFEQSIKNGSFLLGLGGKRIEQINGGKGWQNVVDYNNQIRGAGYKIFILHNGLIVMLMFLCAYYFLTSNGKRLDRYGFGYYLIFAMAFAQASYPDSYAWLIPYIVGMTLNHQYARQSNRISNKKYSLCAA